MARQNSAVKIYQLNYLVGFSISAILFFIACKVFPPPGTNISEPFEAWEGPGVLEGREVELEGSEVESGTATLTKGGVIANEKDATEISV